MIFSLPGKRLIAVIAGALLLLCQTAMASELPGLAAAFAGETALSEACHGIVPRVSDAPDHALHQNCPSEYATPGFAKLDIPKAVDLPALQVRPVWQQAPAHDRLTRVAAPARAEPPPFTIVHCCLRN